MDMAVTGSGRMRVEEREALLREENKQSPEKNSST
jgi:hypothetical protein